MATLSNGQEGPSQLAVRLEILKGEPKRGLISRGCVAMNSDPGLLWVRVRFEAMEQEFFAHDVLLHSMDLRSLADSIMALVRDERGVVHFDDSTSPELSLELSHPGWGDAELAARLAKMGISPDPDFDVNVKVSVNVSIAAGAESVWEGGPALHLSTAASRVATFGRDLRAETEMALVEFGLS